MADSRQIIPPSGPRAHAPASNNAALPHVVNVATEHTFTEARNVDTGGAVLAVALVPEDPRRRVAVVYNPALDPSDGVTPGETIWIGSDPNNLGAFFPLEAGALYEHGSRDWLYGWTAAGAPTNVYIIGERD